MVRVSAWLSTAVVAVMVAGCGAAAPTTTPSPSETSSLTPAPTATPTPAAAATPTSTPIATPTPTSEADLTRVAELVFPPCPDPLCVEHATKFTTCDSGMTATSPSPVNRFSVCPFTVRLAHQLTLDSQGGDSGGAPCDPVGGCQDPEWPNESITIDATQTGAIAHVVLTAGSNVFKTDLVIVASGAQLLVDDIYCAGQDPITTDAYASGWDVRSVCQGA